MKKFLTFLFLITLSRIGHADNQWVLESSTLTYHVSHPLHHADGVSHEARGKGICKAGQCDFLIAVPVKSFDSGDSNRDLHMIQVVRGAQFPIVTVRTHLPQSASASGTLSADVDVAFAGQTAHYPHLTFQQVSEGAESRIVGTIPTTVTDFKIDPPRLLTVPIKNDIPVDIDMTWRSE